MSERIAIARATIDDWSDATKLIVVFAILAVVAIVASFTKAAIASPDLCLIPATTFGVPALFVLAHDLRGVVFDDYLAVPTTAGASLALGVALWLLTIAT